MLNTPSVATSAVAAALASSTRAAAAASAPPSSAFGLDPRIDEVDQAGGCAHPIRLQGVVLDRVNGELVDSGILVPCKDRRAAVCPSCSRLYQADAWQLVAAGLRGGKGVSPDVARHPQLFVTVTAPSRSVRRAG